MKRHAAALVWVAATLAVVAGVSWWSRRGTVVAIPFTQAIEAVQRNEVKALEVSGQNVVIQYKKQPGTAITVIPVGYTDLFRVAQERSVDVVVTTQAFSFWNWLSQALGPVLQIVCVAFLIAIVFMLRRLEAPSDEDTETTTAQRHLDKVHFTDIGGLERAKTDLGAVVVYIKDAESFKQWRLAGPRILVSGPRGMGKSMLAVAVATEAGCPLLTISGANILGSRDPLAAIAAVFKRARKKAPCVVLLENIDQCSAGLPFAMQQIGPGVLVEAELARQVQSLTADDKVAVIATSRDGAAVAPALKGPHVFDREITLSLPTASEREAILKTLFERRAKHVGVDGPHVIPGIARRTAGFTGAELSQIVAEATRAASRAQRTVFAEEDFETAIAWATEQRASAAPHIGFTAAPVTVENGRDVANLTFADVGGNHKAKEALGDVVRYLQRPADFELLGAQPPGGILLVGPPGTGKTMLARSVARQAHCPFFSVSGSAFVELFVGVGASRIRDLFERAKRNSPCILFIDELDAFAKTRGTADFNVNREQDQALNEFLLQMDGFASRQGVVVIAATNRPDILDPAVVRGGRFDVQIPVPLPDREARREIFEVHLRSKREHGVLAEDILTTDLAARTDGFSGADIATLVNAAALHAVRMGHPIITNDNFDECLGQIVPSGTRLDSLKTAIQEFVIGQPALASAVLSTVELHYATTKCVSPDFGAAGDSKPCLAIFGPPGTGKSAVVRKVAEHLGVPFMTLSASELLRSDPFGSDSVHNALARLVGVADGNVLRAERGIVCIKDFHRLLGFHSSHDLQDGLARVIKGSVIDIPTDISSATRSVKRIKTHGILFFLVASQEELETTVRKRYPNETLVNMKRFFHDEQIELVRHGMSDNMIGTISAVTVTGSTSEADLLAAVRQGEGRQLIDTFQVVLNERGVDVELSRYSDKIARSAHSRGEGFTGLARLLRDLSAAVLARPASQAAEVIQKYLEEGHTAASYDEFYRGVDPNLIVAELPVEIGAVVGKSQAGDRGTVILIEQPAAAEGERSTADGLVVWFQERSVRFAGPARRSRESKNERLQAATEQIRPYVEQMHTVLATLTQQLPWNAGPSAVQVVKDALESNAIDALRALVLLRGIEVRVGLEPSYRDKSATGLLVSAHRAMEMMDLVRIGFEIGDRSRDELGRSTRVAAAATALSDGIAEIEGAGLLSEDKGKDASSVLAEHIREALQVTPYLKSAICDSVGRCREALDLPALDIDLDGITARREWPTVKRRLQQRGDIRNTPNLMLLLAAIDSCIRAMTVVSSSEVLSVIDVLDAHIAGRMERVQARLFHWTRQTRALQRLLTGEKSREAVLSWQGCEFNPSRIRAELAPVLDGRGEQLWPSDINVEDALDAIDEYYRSLKTEAIAKCEKHVSTLARPEESVVALLADELESEVVAQHCSATDLGYIRVIPAYA